MSFIEYLVVGGLGGIVGNTIASLLFNKDKKIKK